MRKKSLNIKCNKISGVLGEKIATVSTLGNTDFV